MMRQEFKMPPYREIVNKDLNLLLQQVNDLTKQQEIDHESLAGLTMENYALKKELVAANALTSINVEAELLQRTRERDGWKETAEQHCRNEFYFRGLIEKIATHYGIEAITSDDGSIQQDVICLKVPDLVDQTFKAIKRLRGFLRVNGGHNKLCRKSVIQDLVDVDETCTCGYDDLVKEK